MIRIDLIWQGGQAPPVWPLGAIRPAEATPDGIAAAIASQPAAEAVLFWDGALGAPEPATVLRTYERPGDLWHAGLRLGLGGLPEAIDFVAPTWMLNRDPNPAIESTSWRVSFRCCLVRQEVLVQMGCPARGFASLDAASLEYGHRCLMRGVLVRHVPTLMRDPVPAAPPKLSLEDQFRFVHYRYGRRQLRWALFRAIASGFAGPREAVAAHRMVLRDVCPAEPAPLPHDVPAIRWESTPSVSVILPTLDRYPYLRTLLAQIRRQTVPPCEILISDQSAARDRKLAGDFADLPLKVFYPDTTGQCTARNLALAAAAGDYLLFIDDDDEIRDDLIERHLETLAALRADVSAGVAEEPGAEILLAQEKYCRASDVFPTGNLMLRRSALEGSGLFDLAYDRRQQEDGDLGTRVYLSGRLMVLNTGISVLHHRAPAGGLRTHGVRKQTYAASRARLLARNLPAASWIYQARRYFTPRQVREMLWIAAFGTFCIRGGVPRRLAKAGLAGILLPDTVVRIRSRYRTASALLRDYPQIPELCPCTRSS